MCVKNREAWNRRPKIYILTHLWTVSDITWCHSNPDLRSPGDPSVVWGSMRVVLVVGPILAVRQVGNDPHGPRAWTRMDGLCQTIPPRSVIQRSSPPPWEFDCRNSLGEPPRERYLASGEMVESPMVRLKGEIISRIAACTIAFESSEREDGYDLPLSQTSPGWTIKCKTHEFICHRY